MARPRRRRKWPLRLAITLLVLLILLVVADRVSLVVAERLAADTLQKSQHLSQRPSVSVAGFPFLTQLVAAEFDDVTVTAHDVPVGTSGHTLDIDTLTVDLRDVTVARDLSSVRAATGTADARIDYAALSKVLGARIGYGGGGRLVAHASTTLAGRQVTGTVSAVVHASSSAGLTFTHPRVSVNGQHLPAGADAALGGVFGRAIPLDGLPFGVRVDGVTASSDGLHIRLRGTRLVYRSS